MVLIRTTLFLLFFGSTSLLSYAQNSAIITILKIGTCNNEMALNEYVDSICQSTGIIHQYYIEGLNESEIEQYSKQLFNLQINKNQIVNNSKALFWNLSQYEAFDIIIVKNNKVLKTIKTHDFDPLDLLILDTEPTGELLENNIVNESIDTFNLNYSKKIQLPDDIRLSPKSITKIILSNIYVLDPLFKEAFFKLNLGDESNLKTFRFSSLNLSDSIYKYYYYTDSSFKLIDYDTICKLHKVYIGREKLEISTFFFDNHKIYLIGTIPLMTYIEYENVFSARSHQIVLELDSNLCFLSFYFDRFLSYNGPNYPFFVSSLHSANSIKTSILKDQNEIIKKKNILKFTIEAFHQIKPIDIDSLRIPKDFNGDFFSNVLTDFIKLPHKNESIWYFDPYPYLYFQKLNLYFDLVDTSYSHAISSPKNKNELKSSELIEYRNNVVYIILKYNSEIYRIDYNINLKQTTKYINFGEIHKYNLKIGIDDQGKNYYIPIHSTDGQNYLYLE